MLLTTGFRAFDGNSGFQRERGLDGEQIYLFLLSQEELIWYAEWMAHTDEAAFNEVIVNALGTIEAAAQSEVL